ncbi:unnamed protein product [Enterobius vermicularis]|uniref:NADH dehydrogenase [ubiquinone] iron-sulfur protein 6, mitochondrial n=1 Tax=Enterobius vermicularis TaxID=51028 RepID=A0A0N4V7N8_ENTVE|nr:unnamed protein product [Enterobius vermicularis]
MNKLLNCRFSSYFLLGRTRGKSTVPAVTEVRQSNAVFDKVTHTGQAWDESDYRLQRFEFSKKLVNPNIAQELVAEEPPVEWKERIAFCEGGHGALGHPRVYINLDKPGNHACGYCGQRFFNPHATKGEDKNINHYNC